MSKWERKSLKNITNLMVDGDWIESKDQSIEGVRLVQTGNIGEGIYLDKPKNAKYISEKTYVNLNCTEVFEGDVLISRLPSPVGRACMLPQLKTRMITAVDCSILRFNKNLCLPPYFVFFTMSPNYHFQVSKHLAGSTRVRISRKNLETVMIPLPPLETQKQIAKTLDIVVELLAMRKQQLAELDNLIKSTFYDMFGDPVTNEMGWETVTLGDLNTILTDYHSNGSYEKLRENVELLNEPNYALMIRTTDLEEENYIDDVKYINEEAYEYLEKSKVFGGEIIINKIGSAGKVYLMPHLGRPVSLAMNQFLLRFNHDTNTQYVYYYLNTEFSKKNISDKVRGAVTKTITKDAIRSIPFRLPPLSLQNQFATIVTKIEEQKSLVKKSIEETQHLFDSLMSQYFD
ncbi:restriction endonuclease subunit S [Brevibacillus sp. BC25]|uniref:restriction endonuclease subunit S n=1 Tax=Brevibacillus sp. BC25 TaxID=1144308 RepID=UPI0002710484|nr:restriction endonuclease subunit S [Brevibacillus sp. BC25]EJL20884.1 restriction endonuclease S subunit [Brevibacillus sp. BC25]